MHLWNEITRMSACTWIYIAYTYTYIVYIFICAISDPNRPRSSPNLQRMDNCWRCICILNQICQNCWQTTAKRKSSGRWAWQKREWVGSGSKFDCGICKLPEASIFSTSLAKTENVNWVWAFGHLGDWGIGILGVLSVCWWIGQPRPRHSNSNSNNII